MIFHGLAKLFLIAICPLFVVTAARATENDALMERVVNSYPAFLAGHEGNTLIWKDGTRMPFDDGKRGKTFETLLNAPSIRDMFYAPYLSGKVTAAPDVNSDPGRVRYEPFFLKMYGDCRKGETARTLVDVVWLPKKWGKKIKMTRINGVAEQLSKVSRELDRLPSKYDNYLFPPAGTVNCRVIEGTKRLSAHGSATAIDIAQQHANYWRWAKPDSKGRYPYQNQIPAEIVAIFEKHGFIWGGRWYHYDTMHFEYRPELLNIGAIPSNVKKQKP